MQTCRSWRHGKWYYPASTEDGENFFLLALKSGKEQFQVMPEFRDEEKHDQILPSAKLYKAGSSWFNMNINFRRTHKSLKK
jgi:hypothetical protein